MAESQASKSSRHASLLTPRAKSGVRGSLPSSLSLPRLSLASSSRPSLGIKPELNTSTNSTSSASSSNAVSTPASSATSAQGVGSFRSLRNFLPFGVKQHSTSNGSSQTLAGAQHKTLLSSFPTARRRKDASPARSACTDEHGVLHIQPDLSPQPSPQSSVFTERSGASSGPNLDKSLPLPPPTSPDDSGPPVLATPHIPQLTTDLSIILESETSGISKHVPPMDDSRDISTRPEAYAHDSDEDRGSDDKRFSQVLDLCLLAPVPNRTHNGSPTPGEDSTLDFSTANLPDEIRAAMREMGPRVYASGSSPKESSTPPPKSRSAANNKVDGGSDGELSELTFNLATLDPELAALLSPNRFGGNANTEPALLLAVDAIPPPPLTPPVEGLKGQHSATSSSSSSNSVRRPTTANRSPQRSPSSSLRGVAAQSSPVRRQASPVKSSPTRRQNSPVPVASASSSSPQSSLRKPRRGSAAGDRLNSIHVDSRSRTASRSESRQASRERGATDGSTSTTTRRRAQPLPLRSPLADAGTSRTTVLNSPRERRSSGASRSGSGVGTPIRASTALGAATRTRRVGDSASLSTPSTPATSRPSTSIGIAPRRVPQSRPSYDVVKSHVLFPAERERPVPLRHRTRSQSLGGNALSSPSPSSSLPSRQWGSFSPRSGTAEWLGPRTAKAFAAAGLLDGQREEERTPMSSPRFGSLGRSLRERRSGSGSQIGGHSRLALSETAGSTVGWGRDRSDSRADTWSESPPPFPSGTQRTYASSTAPTSVSTTSSSGAQAEMQSLKDRHAMETEALLSALVDSQRTSKVLRDENTELRDRVSSLEGRLDEVLAQLRRQQTPRSPVPVLPSHPNAVVRPAFIDNPSRPSSSEGYRRSPLRSQAFVGPSEREQSPPSMPFRHHEEHEFEPSVSTPVARHHRRRSSSDSSVFPQMPTNMTLLMHEQDDGMSNRLFNRSVTPPSPTEIIHQGSNNRHTSNLSMTSEVSTTMASASFVPDSPGSLHLRPEHEMHLGDLASLDFGTEREDDDSLDGHSL